MAGTLAGGIKCRETIYKEHGRDFYRNIGRLGGKSGNTGGFASNPELARIAGAKGGRKSKRGKDYTELWNKNKRKALKMRRKGYSYVEISEAVGIPRGALRLRVIKEIKK